MLLPSISYAIREIILRNLSYVQCLNIAQIESMVYDYNGI